MQTIQFKVDNNYLETVLNLLNSLNKLKLNIIEDLLIINNNNNRKEEEKNIVENLRFLSKYKYPSPDISDTIINLLEKKSVFKDFSITNIKVL